MSIPTREIRQPVQDELRALVDPAVWGKLPEEVHDRVLRTLNAIRTNGGQLDEYLTLFNATMLSGVSRFPDLRIDEQRAALDIASFRPNLSDMIALRGVVDLVAASSWSTEVRDDVFDFVAWPARPPPSLSAPPRRRLMRWRATQHGARLTALQRVLRHEVFSQRSVTEQRQILLILHRTSPSGGLIFFHELLDAATTRWAPGTVPSGTIPLLSESLLERITLLEALHRVATSELLPSVTLDVEDDETLFEEPTFGPEYLRATWHSRVLSDLIGEVARPDEYFNQSNRGTCFSTSLLHRLARVRPAEYARIAHELVTTSRSQLQNQEPVRAPDDSHPDDNSSRSVTERMTQAMLSEYWVAGELRVDYRGQHYQNTAPQSHADPTNPSGAGSDSFPRGFIGDSRIVRVATALLGQRFQRVQGNALTHLRNHFTTHPDVPVFAGVVWGDGAHEVDVLAVDLRGTPNPRVRYWNPWGALLYDTIGWCPIRLSTDTVEVQGNDIPAARHEGPARRTEDDSRAIQSMSAQQFQRIFLDLLMPQQ